MRRLVVLVVFVSMISMTFSWKLSSLWDEDTTTDSSSLEKESTFPEDDFSEAPEEYSMTEKSLKNIDKMSTTEQSHSRSKEISSTVSPKESEEVTPTTETSPSSPPEYIPFYDGEIIFEDTETTSTVSTSSPLSDSFVIPLTKMEHLPYSVSSIDKSIQENQERVKNFQLELRRSELEVAYLVMMNLQTKLGLLQSNLSHLLGNECRTVYWNPVTHPQKTQYESKCLTSPKSMDDQILEFEVMLEMNQKFRTHVHSFQSEFNDKIQQLHESYENALRLCSDGIEETQHPFQGRPVEHSLPFPILDKNSTELKNQKEIETILREPLVSSHANGNGNGNGNHNGLNKKLQDIESLSSSSNKISKFKDLIKEIKRNGIQKNGDIFRVASFIKNTKCRADSVSLKSEFPRLVQELIWSEKLSLRVETKENIFKLVISHKGKLVGMEVTKGQEDKEIFGQDWRFSPVHSGNYFVLFNENRKSVIGVGNPTNGTMSQLGNDKVDILIESAVGRDVILMPRDFFWKLKLICHEENCHDEFLRISLVNYHFPSFNLAINSLGNVVLGDSTNDKDDGQFFVVPSPNKIRMGS